MRVGLWCSVILCMSLTLTCVSLFYLAEMRAGRALRGSAPAAAPSSGPDDDVSGAAGSGTSSKTAVAKSGS